ncbi:putative spermidine/putrescine transport system ATP-binding protein/spermidine/putrescine transport system ATP-binding protein [Burkholderia sp. D7]|nr:putative spermidine/putrescine transport system ATP-binding protein/spermidine/putrescine transport system ATP-binding protein [Burkholderia sp. D7]
MTISPATFSFRAVTKRYGAVTAVDNISLDVNGGTFFSLLGPSGSGKTTLLMMAAGFEVPSTGDVTYGTRELTRVPPEKRNFGMVFQGYALFPNLTVAENVCFPLAVRNVGRAEREQRVLAALDLVRLSGFGDRLPKQLSGGQQQRVALARALIFEPDILLLDEPLSALDKKLRIGLQIELRELQRRIGKTFICVTHDQEEALSMSDEIAIVRNGKIVQRGTPEQLFERPATHFVADFLGESNFLEGKVVHADGAGLVRYEAQGTACVQRSDVKVEPGEPILLSLRPSKISLTSVCPPAGGNLTSGMLAGWSYRGTEVHYEVNTPLGRLSVNAPTWQSDFAPVSGQMVWLSWSPDAATIVKDDRGEAKTKSGNPA